MLASSATAARGRSCGIVVPKRVMVRCKSRLVPSQRCVHCDQSSLGHESTNLGVIAGTEPSSFTKPALVREGHLVHSSAPKSTSNQNGLEAHSSPDTYQVVQAKDRVPR